MDGRGMGCDEKEISYELHHALTLYNWHGNVRELINVLHATVQNGNGECRLYPQHLPVDIRAKVLLKRSGRPQTDGYLVAEEAVACKAGGTAGCPLLPPVRAYIPDRQPPLSGTRAMDPQECPQAPRTTNSAPCTPSSPDSSRTPYQTPEGLVGSLTQHKPGNGFARIEGPYIALPLPSENAADSQMPPLRTVRELAMQEVELAYLKLLVASSQGNFQRALTISGLSRARLYDLLSKHSMSISGG